MTAEEVKESNEELRQEAELAEAIDGGREQQPSEEPVVVRPIRRYRARIFQGYLAGATIGFGLLFFYARTVPYFRFDLSVVHWIQGHHALALDAVMTGISSLGFPPVAPICVVATTLLVYLTGLKWEAVMLLFAGAGVGALDFGVKTLAHRHRPTPDLVTVFSVLNDYSFPSGHVLLFTVFLGFLLFLMFTLMPRSWARTCGLSVSALLIALVGVSRVYMGQHWPSDVIGAYLLGSLWLTLTVFLYRKGKKRFFVHQPLAPDEPSGVAPVSTPSK